MDDTYLTLNCHITNRNGLILATCLNDGILLVRILIKKDGRATMKMASCMKGFECSKCV